MMNLVEVTFSNIKIENLASFVILSKTLKSELRLRPTYDELVGMIESQGDPNRPSIEQVVDSYKIWCFITCSHCCEETSKHSAISL